MESGDCRFCLNRIWHFYEAKSAGLSSNGVNNDICLKDLAVLFEELGQ